MSNVVYSEHLWMARGVKLSHTIIVIVATWGWALPWPQSWWITLLLVPMIKLHWKTNDNMCALTSLEHRLRGEENAGTHEQEWFIKGILSLFMKRLPSDENIWLGMNVIMWTSWIICGLRLFIL